MQARALDSKAPGNLIQTMFLADVHYNDLPVLVDCLEKGKCNNTVRIQILRSLVNRKEAKRYSKRIETLCEDLTKLPNSGFDVMEMLLDLKR